jgi:hypothetical protein
MCGAALVDDGEPPVEVRTLRRRGEALPQHARQCRAGVGAVICVRRTGGVDQRLDGRVEVGDAAGQRVAGGVEQARVVPDGEPARPVLRGHPLDLLEPHLDRTELEERLDGRVRAHPRGPLDQLSEQGDDPRLGQFTPAEHVPGVVPQSGGHRVDVVLRQGVEDREHVRPVRRGEDGRDGPVDAHGFLSTATVPG